MVEVTVVAVRLGDAAAAAWGVRMEEELEDGRVEEEPGEEKLQAGREAGGER